MKRLIYPLIAILAVYMSSCQKDLTVSPESKTATGTTAVTPGTSLTQGNAAISDTTVNVTGFIKIELAKDTFNKDNIVIFFKPDAKASYVPGEDAPYMQGFGAESLSSISSNNIALAVNVLPLKEQGDSVKLNVIGKTDAIYKLSLIRKDSVLTKYHFWLMDSFKKDSLDLSQHCSYSFNIYNADTTSFGKNRFRLIVRK
jgi:hypothetical protein